MEIPKAYEYKEIGDLFVKANIPIQGLSNEAIYFLCTAFGISTDYDGLKDDQGLVIDGFEVEDILEELIEKSFELSLGAGEVVVDDVYTEEEMQSNPLSALDGCFTAAIWMWNYICDRVNAMHIPVKNMDTAAIIDGKPYLHMVPNAILFLLFGSLALEDRKIAAPVLMHILQDLHDEYLKEHPVEEDPVFPELDPSMPKELNDDIFKNSGLSELLSLFQEIGTYRPNKDYDNSEDLEKHDRIDELIERVFATEIPFDELEKQK